MRETGGTAAAVVAGHRLIPATVRRLGVVWVCVSLPFVTAAAAWADTPHAYLAVLVFLACGAYTLPGLVAGWYALRRADPRDRSCYGWLYAGLASAFAVGVAVLVGLATGWRWGNPLGVPAVVVAGLAHTIGLAMLVRSRSGHRALSIDVIEALASVVALTAPLVVLCGPALVGADASWFTVPCAAIVPFVISGTYWSTALFVRLGPGRGAFVGCAVALSLLGTANVGLQAAQALSGFTLPPPPLVAFNAVCMSMFLLVPLHVPLLMRPGLDRLPPQAQARTSSLATWVAAGGLAGLLVATAAVADDRPWAVPFALAATSVLFLLASLRQMAAVGETRRLYRQVSRASDERRRLLVQMLERTAHDRRRFAGQLHEQAAAAHASFVTLAHAGGGGALPPVAADASALVGEALARHARSLRELVLAIRPLERDRGEGVPAMHRLAAPIAAYLSTVYGDRPAPALTVEVGADPALDWVAETVLLQIVQEALHNVWRHSEATAVDVTVSSPGAAVVVRVADDGVGFDVTAMADGPGIAAMRASAAVLGGTCAIASRAGRGTTVVARLGPGDIELHDPAAPHALRLVH
jgi:signal transduction histidine kinase